VIPRRVGIALLTWFSGLFLFCFAFQSILRFLTLLAAHCFNLDMIWLFASCCE
jgi:hypothetical protein